MWRAPRLCLSPHLLPVDTPLDIPMVLPNRLITRRVSQSQVRIYRPTLLICA